MSFRITGLSPQPFRHLFGLSDAALAAHGARRIRVESTPGTPDRIGLRDLEPGESALLLNYEHQPADTPFRAAHAIFVHEGTLAAYDRIDEVPDVLRRRMLSLRAFDAGNEMIDADLVDGRELEPALDRFFADPDVAYLHAHSARPGCYVARIDRA